MYPMIICMIFKVNCRRAHLYKISLLINRVQKYTMLSIKKIPYDKNTI